LDVFSEDEFDFFNLTSGIMHSPADVSSLPSYSPPVPDEKGTNDPTMLSTFGLDFGVFGDMTGLGNDAALQLGLVDLIDKYAVPQPAVPAVGVDITAALKDSYAALGWAVPAPTAVRPTLKRKDSDSGSDSAPQKRPRGRPPKSRSDSGSVPPPVAKRPYNRQPKMSSGQVSLSGTPALRAGALADDEDSDAESESAPKLTPSGKTSTARPKSVVPEKYFKDGSAQAITGMTVEQITSFPTFEELLKKVAPALQAGAAEFGERIKENRDKAKDAAKKSREERRQKIDSLEATVAQLEGHIQGMQGVFKALVAKGILSTAEIAMWI